MTGSTATTSSGTPPTRRRLGRHVRSGTARGDGGNLAPDVEALATLVEAGGAHLDPTAIRRAQQVLDRVSTRARLSGEHTVVALAGATGSGKSSLFNALSGVAVATVGIRRPTTSETMAVVWGLGEAHDLLDWLAVARRHRLEHGSALTGPDAADLAGLVLLDLPDHDSTAAANRLEVDRLVELVDMLIWVLDPQKYADAAVHANYLRNLTSHRDVMVVVLNQADKLSAGDLAACLGDLHTLLAADGLAGVPVIATSAVSGQGLPSLRALLRDLIPRKRLAADRSDADVLAAARAFGPDLVAPATPAVTSAVRTELVQALSEAAGANVVARAVDASFRLQSVQATGWPPTKWLIRFRPDPLRRLHLPAAGARRRAPELTVAGVEPVGATSLPPRSPGSHARADLAVRALTEGVGNSLPKPWQRAIDLAAATGGEGLPDDLDAAIAATDLGASRAPRWWSVLRAVAWAVFAVAVAGGLWLLVLAIMSYLRLPEVATPRWHGLPIPTGMLVGGVVAGFVVALVGRIGAVVGGRRRGALARRRIRESVRGVADSRIVVPVETVLADHERCRSALATLLR
jgi:GTP-binding protein EngB required for normal cell division